MPSLKKSLKRIFHTYPGGNRNPYLDPSNPNYNPTQPPPPTTPSRAFNRTILASPRGSSDFLAEARETVGRDRVTGKRIVSANGYQQDASRSAPDLRGDEGGLGRGKDRDRGRGRGTEERSAYADHSSNIRIRSGTKYDLFVQEMKERREGNFKVPEQGYYAPPPREMVEYFAGEAAVGLELRGAIQSNVQLGKKKRKKKKK